MCSYALLPHVSPSHLDLCTIPNSILITRTLDDEELLTQEKYFSVSELQDISLFLKQLAFSMIMRGLSRVCNLSGLFGHCHSLLTLLYSCDARRPFMEPNHWLIKYVSFFGGILVLISDIHIHCLYMMSGISRYLPSWESLRPEKNELLTF